MDYMLEASIVYRIMDSFGLFTKELPTIKTEQYRNQKFPNLWSARVNLFEHTHISANLCTSNKLHHNFHYLTIKFTDDNQDQPIIYCLVCNEADYLMDHIFLYDTNNKQEFKTHKPSALIIANLLKGFEEIREYVPHWLPYEATQEDIKIIHAFAKLHKNEEE